MRQIIIGLIFFVVSSTSQAQSLSQKKSIEGLEVRLTAAYMSKELGQLDAERPYVGKVKIIIEHSLAADAPDRFEVKSFKTLKRAEQWLRSREREDGTPFRMVRELLRCRKGACTYDFDGGILHNQLYLKKITYGYRRGRPYIKTIYLLDGD